MVRLLCPWKSHLGAGKNKVTDVVFVLPPRSCKWPVSGAELPKRSMRPSPEMAGNTGRRSRLHHAGGERPRAEMLTEAGPCGESRCGGRGLGLTRFGHRRGGI